MRAVWISRYGGPDVLEVRESQDPEPAPGEVRVRVRAAGLNFTEVMARQGLYPEAPKPPMVVGYEAAGVVDALGEGVEGPTLGTRVVAASRFGAHADTICVPATMVVELPDELSFEEGASLPVNYLTAWHALHEVARVRPGDHILVQMASGGLGTAMLQVCRGIGGVTTYGTASASKHDYVREQGCDHPIDYRTLDYADEVRRLTAGRGVDRIIDPLGGRDWKKGYGLLRAGGLLVACGFANMRSGSRRKPWHVARQALDIPLSTPMRLMSDNRGVAGINMAHLFDEVALMRAEMNAVMDLARKGTIRPHVHAAVPFAEAADAHRMIETAAHQGKIVLTP